MTFREKLAANYYRSHESLWPDSKDPDYDNKRQIYNAKRFELAKEFKKDLYEEYGVENHPLREKLFHLAWEKGHSSGHSEVDIEFSDLVDLFKDFDPGKELTDRITELLRENLALRQQMAYEAEVTLAHIEGYKTVPKSRLSYIREQVNRMRRVALGLPISIDLGGVRQSLKRLVSDGLKDIQT